MALLSAAIGVPLGSRRSAFGGSAAVELAKVALVYRIGLGDVVVGQARATDRR